MIIINNFIKQFSSIINTGLSPMPWEITNNLTNILFAHIGELDANYEIIENVAIHKTAVVEQNVILKGPIIVKEDCFIGANSYLRGGVFLDKSVKIGANCEIKQSIVCSGSSIAHFNFLGNSIIGHRVNFEAGAVTANHYNERLDKMISVFYQSKVIPTFIEKFGALVGDDSKIGANSVLSPGTILPPSSIVKRLQLIQQLEL
ncbi:MAG TPA: DapH/DapD/GlmU-related protein [Cytophagaceae bacterium]|jgi:NDP-sugar pyrophosphorylase family protein